MLIYHLKVAFRTITRHTGYSLINLFGLAIGIACALIIVLFVRDEMSYDRFHSDADDIYRIVVDRFGVDGSVTPRIGTPGALAEAAVKEIPEIQQATRLNPTYWGKVLLSDDKNNSYYGDDLLYVDNSFLDVFSFPLVAGDAESALHDPLSIVLTETFAARFFETRDAVGRTLILNGTAMQVTGVLQDPPKQSHLQFSFLVSILGKRPQWATNWGEGHMHTYVNVRGDASPSEVETKIQDLMETRGLQETKATYSIQPLAGIHGIHLSAPRRGELGPSGSKLYIQVLLLAAFFILLIAGVNYVNLATARSGLRAKEIGVRKVAGAPRTTLIRQFLIESVLMSAGAAIVAVALAELALPIFNSVMQKELALVTAGNESIWWLLAGTVVLFGLAAGSYPAAYLSSFMPVSVLKNLRASGQRRFRLRQSLVVFQFVLATLLMIGALVVQKQLDFMQSADLGYDKDQVIVIENFNRVPGRDVNFAARFTLAKISGVEKVGSTTDIVGKGARGWGSIEIQGSDNEIEVAAAHVDYDYIETVGIALKEGRHFSPSFESDSTPLAAILNETAVAEMGLEGPVVGRLIDDSAGRTARVVGVVKDFHFASLHDEIGPFVFFWGSRAGTIAIKIQGGTIPETISQIEDTWSRFVPDFPMDYYFLDSEIDQQYRSEQNFGMLFAVMTILSIVVACLGMFGLVSFTAERRTKEVGVRKALGASVANIVALLSKEFVLLVFVANLIAWPLAYGIMTRWLQNFAYHASVGLPVFALAGAIALAIAGLTVVWQAVRAASANPVDSLKFE
jgi:putative ABC transport system permease protein